MTTTTREDVIKKYLKEEYSYSEIKSILRKYGIIKFL